MPNKMDFSDSAYCWIINSSCWRWQIWDWKFTGENRPVEFTILKLQTLLNNLRGIILGYLFDPPYWLEQCKRVNENVERKFTMRDGQICWHWTEIKDLLSAKIIAGGVAISFVWNNEGFVKGRGYEPKEILSVAHGSGYSDTTETAERKVQWFFGS